MFDKPEKAKVVTGEEWGARIKATVETIEKRAYRAVRPVFKKVTDEMKRNIRKANR